MAFKAIFDYLSLIQKLDLVLPTWVVLISAIVYNVYLNLNFPNFDKNFATKEVPSFSKHNLTIPPDSERYKLLVNSTRFAYTNFINKCLGHDEIRPVSGKCVDTYGFNATIVESVETLYLLKQFDLYHHALNFIQENFSCNNIEWVNRRELFSRVVGSFIGSYLITGEEIFLKHAEECSMKAINIDRQFKYPRPYHNFQNNTCIERAWINGTALQDLSPGLPEMVALYHITGKSVYLDYYQKIANALPKKKDQYYPSIFTIPRGMNGSNIRTMDAFTVSFYHNLAIAHSLYPLKSTIFALDKTARLTNIRNSDGISMVPLLNVASYCAGTNHEFYFSGVRNLFDSIMKLYDGNEGLFGNNGFRFDGNFYSILLRKNDQQYKEKILNSVEYALNRTKTTYGFSGFSSNTGSKLMNDIQPANLLGHFIKSAVLAVVDGKLPGEVFLNERGHILIADSFLHLDVIPKPCEKKGTESYNIFCK